MSEICVMIMTTAMLVCPPPDRLDDPCEEPAPVCFETTPFVYKPGFAVSLEADEIRAMFRKPAGKRTEAKK